MTEAVACFRASIAPIVIAIESNNGGRGCVCSTGALMSCVKCGEGELGDDGDDGDGEEGGGARERRSREEGF